MLPGSTHQARTRLFGEPFAMLHVLRVWQEPIGDVSDDDAQAEGYSKRDDFLAAFTRINGDVPLDEVVWCVEFSVTTAGE
jgi:hypothetical protein